MPLRIVQSKQNSRLKLLRQVLSHPGRTDQPVGIEGPNLLAEALRAGLNLTTVFVAQESEKLLQNFQFPPETEILLVPRTLLNETLSTETPQPIAALVDPPTWGWADLKSAAPILVLAALQDPGNLGTILRSAEAFGAAGIIALPGTVSQWNPKALRASAGSAFRLPIITAQPDEAFTWLRKSRRSIWTTAVEGAQSITTTDLTQPIALIIGNEGNGVPAEIAAEADGALTIPCPGPVESLNAAVAASVLLYEISRQRATTKTSATQPKQARR